MRLFTRLALALALLLVVGIGALLLLLPKIVQSPEIRAGIEQVALDTTGRSFSYEELSFGLFPPRLILREPVLSGEAPGDPPFVEAATIDLKLALAPLFARVVLVDSLTIDGASLVLVRTKDGVSLPGPPQVSPGDQASAEKAPTPESKQDDGPRFGIRRFTLSNSSVVLIDRTFSPPQRFALEQVNLTATGSSPDAPIEVALSGQLARGGDLEVSGDVRLDGELALVGKLGALDLAGFSPLLGAGRSVAGSLDMDFEVIGPAAEPQLLRAELHGEKLAVIWDDVHYDGPLLAKLELTGPLAQPEGLFSADASGGKIVYGDAVFTKPAGTPATVSGQIITDSAGNLGLDNVNLKIHRMDARASLRNAPLRISIEVPPFELEGWEELIQALGDTPLQGKLAFEGLSVSPEPFALSGTVWLDEVSTRVTEVGMVAVLSGEIEARGVDLIARDLVVELDEQPFQIEGGLSNILDAPYLDMGLTAVEVDLERLLAGISASEPIAAGPLSLKGRLAGPLRGEESVGQRMQGSLRLDIGEGVLRGVSLLRSAMKDLGNFGEAALLLGQMEGGSTIQAFYEDNFDWVGGTFELKDGVARTGDLQLRYSGYQVDLAGVLDIATQAIEGRGKLTLLPELDRAIDEATGGDETEGEVTVIPLARVRGTLSEPKVDLSPQAVVALMAEYSGTGSVKELEQELDEKYGEGTGKAVRGLLDSILGGRD